MNPAEEAALVQAALSAIDAIITTVKNAKSGAVDPQTALASITAMQDALGANDAAEATAEAAKFPGQ
ncbi:MAG TPA: hypothetical protein VGF94_08090 [Kofleriaceae bacterium]|jgi:hypothetical protein